MAYFFFWSVLVIIYASCVQRPASEMVRAVNKFKADFGGQVVSLERVQPSSDHVPHRCSCNNIHLFLLDL